MINERTITVTTTKDIRTVFVVKEGRFLRNKGNYIRSFQEVMLEIAKDRSLNLTDHRVLMAILGSLQFENRVELTHTEIGKLIEVERPNVSTSMHKLEARGFIRLVETKGKRKIYLLCPYIAFKTKSKNLHDLEEEWDDMTLEETEAS